MAQMTRTEVLKRIRGLAGPQRKSTVCALIGHSRIVDGCMGEVYCGRCDTKIADQLMGGYAGAEDSVRIGHNCRTCRSNFRKMTWRDKFLVPNPFTKRERSGED